MQPEEYLGQHCTFDIAVQPPSTIGEGVIIAHSTRIFNEDHIQYLVASNDLGECYCDVLTSKILKDWADDPLTYSYINQVKNIEEFVGYRYKWFLSSDINPSSYSLEELINFLNKEIL